MNGVLWRTDNRRRWRAAWKNSPELSGDRAPLICQVAGCDTASYVVVQIPEHMTVVCLPHADQLYVDCGYTYIGDVMVPSEGEG